jgi:lia operon protein LiaG
MKKIVLTLLSIMVIAYGIGAIILFASPQSVFNGESGRFTINEEKTSDSRSIDEINVSTSSTTINIIESDSSEIKAHLYGNVTTTSRYQKPDLQFDVSGDTLTISVKNRTTVSFGFFNTNLKLDVFIPKEYNKNLKLASSSGSIHVKNLKLESLSMSTASGSSNIENITAKDFSHSSSSGSLRADGLTTEKAKSSSSSGSRRLFSFTGDLTTNSSSGSTEIQYSSFANSLKANASSGSISITLPENAEFELQANASSGSIKCEFPITMKESSRNRLAGTVGSGTNKISINTSSGSIRINR